MATKEQLVKLLQTTNISAFNQYRKDHPDEKIDLCRADLGGLHLLGVDFHGVALAGADLRETDLRAADLSEANVYGADLTKVDLSEANVFGVVGMTHAILVGIDWFGVKGVTPELDLVIQASQLLTRATVSRSTRP